MNRNQLLWGLASLMGLACSALWAAQPLDEAGLPINAGMAGSWANANIPGQGLFIDVDPVSRTIFLAWFTYTDSPLMSESTIGSADNHWFIALGTYEAESSSVEMSLIETQGGVFDQSDPVSETEVGQLILRFNSCESAEMDFLFDENNLQGSIEMMRLTAADVCTSLAES